MRHPQSITVIPFGMTTAPLPGNSTQTTLPLYGISITKLTTLGTESLLPATAETPALSDKLRHMVHVARRFYPSSLSGMCGLPARHSFRSKFLRPISPYERRRLGYPLVSILLTHPEKRCHSSAPSPMQLTSKPFLTYSVRPFMVELFTARFLAQSPRESHSV